MAITSVSQNNAQLQKAARGVIGMLTLTFLLGMAVNLIGLPDEATGGAKVATGTFLGLHVLIGIGLLVSAISATRASRTLSSDVRMLARVGGASIGLTFIFGVLTYAVDNNWWSYLMAAGFMASLLLYGKILTRSRT